MNYDLNPIPCTDCKKPTMALMTKLCDQCWEARRCLTELSADRDAWRARAESAEAELASADSVADEISEVTDARVEQADAETVEWASRYRHAAEVAEKAEARATQAEAQAAAMLVVFREWEKKPCKSTGYWEGDACSCCDERASKLDPPCDDNGLPPGHALLAELEALRALETEVRDSLHCLSDRSCPGCQSAMAKDNLETELRAVDAARKGE